MIRKLFISFAFLGVLALGYRVVHECSIAQSGPTTLKIPGARSEESALRRAWALKRLVDPATGKIPSGITWLESEFAKSIPLAQNDGIYRDGDGEWTFRGPYNFGGRTRALAMDVLDENHLVAGGVSGGIWSSFNGGQSWVRSSALDLHPGCVSIAQDRRTGKTNVWYAMSGEIYGTSAGGGGAFYLGDGLFKSTDNGATWLPVAPTAGGSPNSFSTDYQGGWRVITDPFNTTEDVVYLATYGSIFRSTNGGTSWTNVLSGTGTESYFTDIAITSTGVLYATMSDDGSKKGVWRSTNGTNWVNITPANYTTKYDRMVIGINPNNENEVYFLGTTPDNGHSNFYISSIDWSSLYKYTYIADNGAGVGGQWENRSMNLPNTGTQFDKFAAQGGYDLVVKIQPGTNAVYIGGTNTYRSTDGFATADNTTKIGGYAIGTELPFFEIYPVHHPDQHDLLFLPSNPKVLLNANDGGIFRTENCEAPSVTWTSLNNGYQTTQIYTVMMDMHTANDTTLIAGLQDNGNLFAQSTGPNSNWVQTVNGDGSHGGIPAGKPFYVLSIQQGRVAKCNITDNGTVTAFRRIDPIGPVKEDYDFINVLALDPNDSEILYLPAGKRLYRQNQLSSIELTGVWDSIAQGWTAFPDTVAQGKISAIAVSEANPSHRVYLGTENNKLYRIDDANVGTPAMVALPTPSTSSSNFITCIAIDPSNADEVIVVYSNYNIYSLYRSKNGGQTWEKVGGNLEANVGGSGSGPSIRWLSILPFPDGTRKYFAGTSVGLYSADTLKLHANMAGATGTQWVKEASDVIGNTVVDMVIARAADGYVVAGTHGNGVFSATYSPSNSIYSPYTPLAKVTVYPNPTSGMATVKVDEVTLPRLIVISDASGKVLRTQSNDGAADIPIDLTNLPAGQYFLHVQSDSWRKTLKVVKK